MYIKPQMVYLQDGPRMATPVDRDRNDYLPPEGRDVPWSDYWQRMLNNGSVVAAPDPESRAVAVPASKPPKES